MGAISYIPGADPAVIAAIVQAELALNPPGSQLPTYSNAPSGFSNGQMYRNDSDGKVYMMENTVWRALDITTDSFTKTLTAGMSAIIPASEHNLTSVSGIQLRSSLDKDVMVDFSVNTGLTVTINSEINLNNYKLIIFA